MDPPLRHLSAWPGLLPGDVPPPCHARGRTLEPPWCCLISAGPCPCPEAHGPLWGLLLQRSAKATEHLSPSSNACPTLLRGASPPPRQMGDLAGGRGFLNGELCGLSSALHGRNSPRSPCSDLGGSRVQVRLLGEFLPSNVGLCPHSVCLREGLSPPKCPPGFSLLSASRSRALFLLRLCVCVFTQFSRKKKEAQSHYRRLRKKRNV